MELDEFIRKLKEHMADVDDAAEAVYRCDKRSLEELQHAAHRLDGFCLRFMEEIDRENGS